MQILSVKDYCIPLSATYTLDTDLNFKKYQIITPEGFNLFSENIFSNFKDAKINNYSNIVLSDNVLLNDVINVNIKPIDYIDVFSTTLALYAYNGVDDNTKFVTFNNCNGQYYYSKLNDAIDTNSTYFTVTLLNTLCATVTHQNNNILYYLSYSPTASALELTQNSPYIFRYQLDKNSNCLSLFVIYNSQTYIVSDIADRLTISPVQTGSNIFFNSSTYFNINYYKNNLTSNLNTTWISYDITDRNSLKANPDKSKLNLANNILFTSQYSYIKDNSIDYNFLVLKNQFTHKNYSYRSDNVNRELNEDTPQVQNRFYSNVFTGNQQELGDSNITLNYECYNTDYLFKPDQYTIFNTSPSLYPFEQLNVNDTLWSKAGAIGGDSPYYSDKIFTKRDQSAYSYNDGQYLCTWLLTDNANTPGVWVDRYYNPSMISYVAALTAGTVDVIDTYNNPVLSAIAGEFTFVDKKSDLVFTPSTEYIYHRIGEKYVDEIVTALSRSIIQDGLDLITAKGTEIVIEGGLDDQIYNLNNNSYALITNYNKLNENSQFTLSFWLGADNWQQEFGHQIVGNLTDRGFGVMYDQLVTPFINVPALTGVYIYNTDFNLIDTVRFESSEFAPSSETIIPNDYTSVTYTTAYFVKTLHRTDHLAPAGAIVVPKILTCTLNSLPPTECNCGVLLTETFDYINTETDLNLLIEPCKLFIVPCITGSTVYSAVTTLCAAGFQNVLVFETTTSTSVTADNSNVCIVDTQTPECDTRYCSNDIQIVLNYAACGTTTTTTTITPTTPAPGTGTAPPNSTPGIATLPSFTTTTTTTITPTTPQPEPPPGCTSPANDMFANAINYGNAEIMDEIDNTQCATAQSGETITGNRNGSIWYRITPVVNSSTGYMLYNFNNLDGDTTTFTIYSSVDNTLNNLVSVAGGDAIQSTGYPVLISLSAQPPSNIYVRIATNQTTPKQSRVQWSLNW